VIYLTKFFRWVECFLFILLYLPFRVCYSSKFLKMWLINFEARHPHCVGSITKDFCVLHIQSNTTIFHLVVQ